MSISLLLHCTGCSRGQLRLLWSIQNQFHLHKKLVELGGRIPSVSLILRYIGNWTLSESDVCIVLVWTPCSKHWLTRFKPFLKCRLLVLTPAPLSLDIEPSQWVLCKEHSTRESSICLLSVPDMLCVSPHHWPLIMMYVVYIEQNWELRSRQNGGKSFQFCLWSGKVGWLNFSFSLQFVSS